MVPEEHQIARFQAAIQSETYPNLENAIEADSKSTQRSGSLHSPYINVCIIWKIIFFCFSPQESFYTIIVKILSKRSKIFRLLI